MQDSSAHQSKWKIIDVVVGLPALACFLLQGIFPVTLGLPVPYRLVFIGAGIVSSICGVLLVSAGRRELAKHRQPTDPGHPTGKIVKSGVYSISRNPLNLGALLVFAGLGFVFRNLWFFILLFPAAAASTIVLIRPEEAYLSAKFGKEYDEYRGTVRRWIGRRKARPV